MNAPKVSAKAIKRIWGLTDFDGGFLRREHRPAALQLLDDVRAGKVDVIVSTRSTA